MFNNIVQICNAPGDYKMVLPHGARAGNNRRNLYTNALNLPTMSHSQFVCEHDIMLKNSNNWHRCIPGAFMAYDISPHCIGLRQVFGAGVYAMTASMSSVLSCRYLT